MKPSCMNLDLGSRSIRVNIHDRVITQIIKSDIVNYNVPVRRNLGGGKMVFGLELVLSVLGVGFAHIKR